MVVVLFAKRPESSQDGPGPAVYPISLAVIDFVYKCLFDLIADKSSVPEVLF